MDKIIKIMLFTMVVIIIMFTSLFLHVNIVSRGIFEDFCNGHEAILLFSDKKACWFEDKVCQFSGSGANALFETDVNKLYSLEGCFYIDDPDFNTKVGSKYFKSFEQYEKRWRDKFAK